VLATAKEAFAVTPGVTEIRIVVLRNAPADAYGKVRPEAILAARIARAALNGVQLTKADALTILNEISSELVTRIAGPSKAFASLDLKTEPEIARLIHVATSHGQKVEVECAAELYARGLSLREVAAIGPSAGSLGSAGELCTLAPRSHVV
jgi:hypothetical protein